MKILGREGLKSFVIGKFYKVFISLKNMAKDQGISMPGVFGGLMRYNSEYKSNFMFKPSTVIGVIIAFAVLILGLNVF
jgi:preprotein translocase subunit Sec61beta